MMKQNIKHLINRLGYDVKLHRIGKAQQNQTKFAFVHVPKSGGISIDLAMREQLAKPGEARFSREGAIEMSLATFNQEITDLDSITQFSDHHAQQLNGLLAYHLAQNWQYISGHVSTNQHIIENFAQQYHFITVLREPVSRFVSNYIYNKLTNSLPIMAPNNLNSDNLIEEVDLILGHRRGWQMANVMSMCITGRFAKDVTDAEKVQSEFADNLAAYKVVGFLDNLNSFSEKIKQLSNKQINIGNHNTTDSFLDEKKQHVKSTLQSYFNEPNVKTKLEHLCRFDIQNYQRAKDKYS
ncbi:sulfotransferase family 2 domain-containing protein [Pseudoalteromonas aliena]|nr:sulfotransferase family 2 domain-containing protein [Pseudoalteromonas aliena]